jgi:hypothetical protein
VALPALLFSEWLRRSLGHDAATPALTAAQALYVGGDWRVKIEANANEIVSRQASFMPAVQATHDH